MRFQAFAFESPRVEMEKFTVDKTILFDMFSPDVTTAIFMPPKKQERPLEIQSYFYAKTTQLFSFSGAQKWLHRHVGENKQFTARPI